MNDERNRSLHRRVSDALWTIDRAIEVLEDRQRPAMAEDLEAARRMLARLLGHPEQDNHDGN